MGKNRKKRKIVWQQYVGIVFMMLIGAVCGIVMVSFVNRNAADTSLRDELLMLAGLFIGMYIALFFHLIAHEVGHLVFGLLTGYRFSSFRVASFMLVKENGRLKLRRLSLMGTGGQCLMTPPDLKDGKLPVVLYNLGGSLVNVILGAIFLAGYFLCTESPFFSPLLLIFAVVGFAIAMMNGIPMRMGTVDNDGYNAFALSKNPEAVEAFWVQLKIVEQSSKGIRLNEMPAEWFSVPTDEAMKNSMAATRGVFTCNRLMDEGRFIEADALMAHLLEIESGIVGLHRNLLVCDRLFVELIGENRPKPLRDMMTKEQVKFMKSMKRFPSVLRTQYTLALLSENDPAKAEMIRNEFEKAAKSYPYPHEIEGERELMRIAESKTAVRREAI